MPFQQTPDSYPADLAPDIIWSIFECMQEGVFAVKGQKFVLVNSALCHLLGYARSELIGKSFLDTIGPDYKTLVQQRAEQRLRGETPPDHYEVDLIKKDGGIIHAQIKVSAFIRNQSETFNVGSVRDITHEKAVLKQLKNSEQEFRRIVENLPDMFYRTDAEGVITMASPFAANILGYDLSQFIGKNSAGFYANPDDRAAIVEQIKAGQGKHVTVEACLRHRDGSLVWVLTHACARYDEAGQYSGVEGVSRNITERKLMEQQLRHLAIRDPLTEVFNRTGYEECMSGAISRAKRHNTRLALVYFDIDKFKQVNDTYGHNLGDRYLLGFSKCLTEGFRETDSIARLGGDEFVVILEDINDQQVIDSLLARALSKLKQGFVEDDLRLPYLFSYGLAVYPEDGNDSESLLRFADHAMYRAKALSKGDLPAV